jgi:hypothetical protein
VNNFKQERSGRQVAKAKQAKAILVDDKMLTMQQAMDYLSSKGFPCQSRNTFYRVLEDFNIPYTVINPEGKHKVRRFPQSGLANFLKSQGLEA